MPLVEQELLTLPENLSSPPVFSGVRVTRSLVLYVGFVHRFLYFVHFLLAIVLSVLLRYTDSDFLFGIFNLFLRLIKDMYRLYLGMFITLSHGIEVLRLPMSSQIT